MTADQIVSLIGPLVPLVAEVVQLGARFHGASEAEQAELLARRDEAIRALRGERAGSAAEHETLTAETRRVIAEAEAALPRSGPTSDGG